MNRPAIFICLALSACSASPAYSPAPISPIDAGRIVAQASATQDAALQEMTQLAAYSGATSTALINSATSQAMTPTAAALELAMTQDADRAAATSRAINAAETMTPEARSTQARATEISATGTADYLGLAARREARETATAEAHNKIVTEQGYVITRIIWGMILFFFGVALVILLFYLWAYAHAKIAELEAKRLKLEAEATMSKIQRAGDSVIWMDADGNMHIEIISRRLLTARSTPTMDTIQPAQETPHIPSTYRGEPMGDIDMSGKEDHRGEIVEFLERCISFQESEPQYPVNRIPTWKALGMSSAETWMRLTGYLDSYLTKGNKGTYVNGRFEDVADLLARIQGGSVVPG